MTYGGGLITHPTERQAMNGNWQDFASDIIEAMPDSILVLDTNLEVKAANKAFYRTFDSAPGQTIGSRISLLDGGCWNHPRLKSALRAVIGGDDAPAKFEIEYNSEATGHKTFRFNVRPLHDRDDPLILLTIEDITEWAKRALPVGEARLRLLFEHSPDALFLIDPYDQVVPWRIVDCNDSACQMNGYTRDELLGQSANILAARSVNPPDRTHFLERLRAEGIVRLESMHRREDGTLFPVETSNSFVTLDEQELILCIDRDITDQKRVLDLLRESERFARSTVDALSTQIAILDEQGTIIAVNESWRDFADAHETEEGNYFRKVNYLERCQLSEREDDAKVARGIRSVIDGALDQFHHEYARDTVIGERWFATRVTRFPDAGPLRIAVAHEDITERKKAEEAEREQRVMAEALRDTVAALLSSALDLDEVLDRILSHVARVVPHDTATLMLVDDNVAHVARCRGFSEQQTDDVMELTFEIDKTPNLRAMMATKRSVIIEDTHTFEGWRSNISALNWIRSNIGTPIWTEEQFIGFLNLDSASVSAFTREQAAQLQVFANQVGIAIQNARLYEALQLNAKELSALYNANSFLFKADSLHSLGQQITQAVVSEFAKIDCGLLLVDRERDRFIRLARTGIYDIDVDVPLRLDGPGLVPEAVRTGKAIYAPDVSAHPLYVSNAPQTQSELVIPLQTAKGIVGVFDLQSPAHDAFTEGDQRILAAFAERAAVAIENMQLYEELNSYAADLEWRVAKRTAELNQAKTHVEMILNYSSDAIIKLLEDGAIQQTNPSFDRLFGYDVDEMFGHPLSDLVCSDHTQEFSDALNTVVETGDPMRIELAFRRADGTLFDADVALAPVLEYKTEELNVICSLRDITQRKRIEEDLRKAFEKQKELSELKTRFISMVSHEFRTPLTALQTSTELLRDYSDRMPEEKKKKHFERIKVQIRRLTQMLEDVLIISRAETVGLDFNPVPVDLADFCQHIVDDIQLISSGHSIDLTVMGDCSDVFVDTKLMRQIITNLLTNAVKYSSAGSTVKFEVLCENGEVCIQISDQGIGIPEEDMKHLFQPFHRAKNVGERPGTGLGLKIVKQAVELHGGTIHAESQENVGTTFTMKYPIKHAMESENS